MLSNQETCDSYEEGNPEHIKNWEKCRFHYMFLDHSDYFEEQDTQNLQKIGTFFGLRKGKSVGELYSKGQ